MQYDWNKLKFLESTTNLKAAIKRTTGRTPSTEIARDIAACLQQGRLFFEIAALAPLQVQPLQIYYGIVGFAKAIVLARGVRESFTLIRGLGYRIYPRSKTRINGAPAWVVAAMLWFLSRITPFRELLATGKNECRALVDAMLAAAPRAKPAIRAAMIEAMKPS